MHVPKIVNAMSTNTLSPSAEWCNEAYENADIIIYDNSIYWRVFNDINNSNAYFTSLIGYTSSYTIKRIVISKNNSSFTYSSKTIQF